MTRPDLSGQWAYQGAALTMDGSTLYDWTARVTIDHRGDTARIETETAKSRSLSNAALVYALPDGRTAMLYDYVADPTHEATQEHDFFGMTRFLFDAEGRHGEGHYFNYNGRYTYGRLTLTRV